MAIVNDSSAVGLEDAGTVGAIVTQIAASMGGQNDDEMKVQIRAALIDAVRYANGRVWMDRYFEPSVPLVAGTSTYDLEERFAAPYGRAWLADSNGNRRMPVNYLPRRKFVNYIRTETTTGGGGLPFLYTIQNKLVTGQFEVWGVPNAANVANYPNIIVPYLALIRVPTDDNAKLGVGQPLEFAIIEEARVRAYDYLERPEMAQNARTKAMAAWMRAEADDNDQRKTSTIRGSYGRGM